MKHFFCVLLFSFLSSISLYSFLLFSLCCFAVRLSLDSQPNRILLVTIHHMLYPITVDVLHQVFSPHGFVEKIVTFQKSAGQHLQVSLSLSLYSVHDLFLVLDLRLSGIYGRIKRGKRISFLYHRTSIYGFKSFVFRSYFNVSWRIFELIIIMFAFLAISRVTLVSCDIFKRRFSSFDPVSSTTEFCFCKELTSGVFMIY